MSTENKAEDSPVAEKLGYTQSQLIRFKYTWVIDGFGCVIKRNIREDYVSSVFSPGCNGKLKFYLVFTDYYELRLCLNLLPCDVSEMSVNCRASFLNGNGKAVLSLKGHPIRTSVSATEKTGRPGLTISTLTSGDYGLLESGHLTIVYEILLIIHEISVPVNRSVIKAPECCLYGDMGDLLENQNFTDVTIEVCELKLPAHKAILSARSRVFSAMFKNEMVEKHENRVEVTDVEPEVMKELLRYIYTGQVPFIETIADKLLMAAEKYELERLKLMCAETLRTKLTPGNAVDTLILADLHNVDQLKVHVIDYIVFNAVEVMEMANFKAMFNSHPFIIAEILRVATMRRNPEPDDSVLNFLD